MEHTQPKWTRVVKDITDGDAVFVLKKDLPRRKWPLGRIVAIHIQGEMVIAEWQRFNSGVRQRLDRFINCTSKGVDCYRSAL